MINKNELLSVVDEYDTPLEPLPREKVKSEGYWFRAVHVWILNKENKVLVQKRSMNKDQGAGLWEPSVMGHIGHKDNYFTGAAREVSEETGLSIKPEDLSLVKIYKDNNFREFRGVFICKVDFSLRNIKREEEEVDTSKFLSIPTLKKYLRADKNKSSWVRHPYEKEMLSLLN